jgi:hypothetical protein
VHCVVFGDGPVTDDDTDFLIHLNNRSGEGFPLASAFFVGSRFSRFLQNVMAETGSLPGLRAFVHLLLSKRGMMI